MRKIHSFEHENLALRFWNFLKKNSIDSSLEEDADDSWSVWVADEDQIDLAQNELNSFLQNPEDKKFIASNLESKSPELIKGSKQKKPSGFQQFDLGKQWRHADRAPGVYTLSIIITSVAIYLVSMVGYGNLIIDTFKLDARVFGGEVWRFVTPILIHFHIFHIFFNMWWLFDLGTQIERKKGSKFFLTFVLLLALSSNMSEYLVQELSEGGRTFGGMSGVVYGLFGYVWAKCKFDPADGFRMDPTVAIIMFGFFFLCFTKVFGNIANYAHTGGLLLGIAWGYASAFKWNRG